jgi:hypothetical protein
MDYHGIKGIKEHVTAWMDKIPLQIQLMFNLMFTE